MASRACLWFVVENIKKKHGMNLQGPTCIRPSVPNFHLFFFGVRKIKILLKKGQSSAQMAGYRWDPAGSCRVFLIFSKPNHRQARCRMRAVVAIGIIRASRPSSFRMIHEESRAKRSRKATAQAVSTDSDVVPRFWKARERASKRPRAEFAGFYYERFRK
jgi:hypothetical protein